jgi:hemoglobin-like flavoprotein
MLDHGEIFTQSYWRVVNETVDIDDFVDTFYQKFLNSSDEVREKFKNTDFERQRRMLAQSFLHIESVYTESTTSERMQEIAQIHSKQGRDIPPHLYDLWISCLIETASEYDKEFDESVAAAWRTVMRPGIEFMKAYYRNAL